MTFPRSIVVALVAFASLAPALGITLNSFNTFQCAAPASGPAITLAGAPAANSDVSPSTQNTLTWTKDSGSANPDRFELRSSTGSVLVTDSGVGTVQWRANNPFTIFYRGPSQVAVIASAPATNLNASSLGWRVGTGNREDDFTVNCGTLQGSDSIPFSAEVGLRGIIRSDATYPYRFGNVYVFQSGCAATGKAYWNFDFHVRSNIAQLKNINLTIKKGAVSQTYDLLASRYTAQAGGGYDCNAGACNCGGYTCDPDELFQDSTNILFPPFTSTDPAIPHVIASCTELKNGDVIEFELAAVDNFGGSVTTSMKVLLLSSGYFTPSVKSLPRPTRLVVDAASAVFNLARAIVPVTCTADPTPNPITITSPSSSSPFISFNGQTVPLQWTLDHASDVNARVEATSGGVLRMAYSTSASTTNGALNWLPVVAGATTLTTFVNLPASSLATGAHWRAGSGNSEDGFVLGCGAPAGAGTPAFEVGIRAIRRNLGLTTRFGNVFVVPSGCSSGSSNRAAWSFELHVNGDISALNKIELTIMRFAVDGTMTGTGTYDLLALRVPNGPLDCNAGACNCNGFLCDPDNLFQDSQNLFFSPFSADFQPTCASLTDGLRFQFQLKAVAASGSVSTSMTVLVSSNVDSSTNLLPVLNTAAIPSPQRYVSQALVNVNVVAGPSCATPAASSFTVGAPPNSKYSNTGLVDISWSPAQVNGAQARVELLNSANQFINVAGVTTSSSGLFGTGADVAEGNYHLTVSADVAGSVVPWVVGSGNPNTGFLLSCGSSASRAINVAVRAHNRFMGVTPKFGRTFAAPSGCYSDGKGQWNFEVSLQYGDDFSGVIANDFTSVNIAIKRRASGQQWVDLNTIQLLGTIPCPQDSTKQCPVRNFFDCHINSALPCNSDSSVGRRPNNFMQISESVTWLPLLPNPAALLSCSSDEKAGVEYEFTVTATHNDNTVVSSGMHVVLVDYDADANGNAPVDFINSIPSQPSSPYLRTGSSASFFVDTTAPQLTCPQDKIAKTVSFSLSTSASDVVSTSFGCEFSVNGIVVSSSSVTHSGPVFTGTLPEGRYNVQCSVSDDVGNVGRCSFAYTVDLTPPVVVGCPSRFLIRSNDPTASVPGQLTATDNFGVASFTCVPAPGTPEPRVATQSGDVGVSTFGIAPPQSNEFVEHQLLSYTCTAVDFAGWTSSKDCKIHHILDSSPVTVSCPGTVEVNNNVVAGPFTATSPFSGFLRTSWSCSSPTLGLTVTTTKMRVNGVTQSTATLTVTSGTVDSSSTITCTVTDKSGNSAQCTVGVGVPL